MLFKIFSRKGAKTQSLRIKPIPKKFRFYLGVFAPLRENTLFFCIERLTPNPYPLPSTAGSVTVNVEPVI
jgi:hypothetical protein